MILELDHGLIVWFRVPELLVNTAESTRTVVEKSVASTTPNHLNLRKLLSDLEEVHDFSKTAVGGPNVEIGPEDPK